MPKIAFQTIKFKDGALQIIAQANAIIADYAKQGYKLTLRQLYYQFVSMDLIENKVTEYKRLGSVINDGRLAGLIDWNAIEDRGRNLISYDSWDAPSDIIESAARGYALDPWVDQSAYIEVWVEKEALIGVVAKPCDTWRCPHFACKGYVSQSEMWDAGYNRLSDAASSGKDVTIIHLGDHDPSGIDMTRDIRDRLSLFADAPVEVVRIALNMDQVRKHNPPPNPAKLTDSRFGGYAVKYGNESWELDALKPTTIAKLIEKEIEQRVDQDAWDEVMEREQRGKDELEQIVERYDDVVEFLRR